MPRKACLQLRLYCGTSRQNQLAIPALRGGPGARDDMRIDCYWKLGFCYLLTSDRSCVAWRTTGEGRLRCDAAALRQIGISVVHGADNLPLGECSARVWSAAICQQQPVIPPGRVVQRVHADGSECIRRRRCTSCRADAPDRGPGLAAVHQLRGRACVLIDCELMNFLIN